MSLPALRPQCSTCGEFLELRTPRTREQAFCGTWYDHPPRALGMLGHTATALLPSLELTEQLQAMSGAAVV
ncbi:hypothetical protein D2E95_01500 [Mycobacteroides abscessus]|uniref:hypothetical protein n=1 Tax=Mycobacteroides abscessus TaxID=36809 RepID=UPI000E67EECD|nr:hypothetical protein [Mycobacteroides abscessus]RIT64032.1 hypothetical protein D2E95_01500 [Mycobacteroides abscessus]RIU49821.1 hypothetical protein D2F02_15815 [Mycobacteroides abscessus]